MADAERFAFRVEWLDTVASLRRQYILTFYDKKPPEVEMINVKTGKLFLKRTQIKDVKLSDLIIGAKVTILGRQLTIVDFEDKFTKSRLAPRQARCFALVTGSAIADIGTIWEHINAADLKVKQMMMAEFSSADSMDVFGSSSFTGKIIAMELVGPNAVQTWHDIMDQLKQQRYTPEFTGLLGAETADAADKYLNSFFGSSRVEAVRRWTAKCGPDSALAIVKPHAVAAGNAGHIIGHLLQSGLEMTAMQMFDIDLKTAEEFHEVYKGVLPQYMQMCVELAAGPLVAIELTGQDAVVRLRELAGPLEVEVARSLRPKSIRALYGVDPAKNALHVTDLVEDGPLECEYFFRLLSDHE